MLEQMIPLPEELVRRGHKPERRAVVRHPCTQTITCSVFPSYERFGAQVQDISAHGIGMVMTRAFKPDTLLIIEMARSDRPSGIAIPSRVTQCTRLGKAYWSIGCEFDRPLNHELLNAIL
jgi:hypothetical protein